jgi:hypothetical protein
VTGVSTRVVQVNGILQGFPPSIYNPTCGIAGIVVHVCRGAAIIERRALMTTFPHQTGTGVDYRTVLVIEKTAGGCGRYYVTSAYRERTAVAEQNE